jgi:hypothetical protein
VPHLSAAFVIDRTAPRALDVAGDGSVDYGGMTLWKTFSGAIDGSSVVEMLYTSTPRTEGTFTGRGYVALERITGIVDGRSGSFALLHISTVDGADPPLSKYVISPGSGSGELVGISGVALITIDDDDAHALHLDYELE